MAYTFLKAQSLPGEVSWIDVDAAGAKAAAPRNCTVDNVQAIPGGLSFDCKENALPMVVPGEARPALELVPFMQELNRQTLHVSGLKDLRYSLKIDDLRAGEYSAAELAAGVELAANPYTPQYRQSENATRLNLVRHNADSAWRAIAVQNYEMSRAKIDLADHQKVEKFIHDRMESEDKAGKGSQWRAAYFKELAEPGKLQQQYEQAAADLARACQPRLHHFTLIGK